jgi:hypothetical protein
LAALLCGLSSMVLCVSSVRLIDDTYCVHDTWSNTSIYVRVTVYR